MLNKVILMGRITRELEVKYLQNSDHTVTRFTIAVDKRKKAGTERAEANFINCVAWDKTGEFISKYFDKGRMIGIIGRIDTGSYTNEDGKKVYTTEIIVDEPFFTGEKKAEQQEPADNPNDFMTIPDTAMDGFPFN